MNKQLHRTASAAFGATVMTVGTLVWSETALAAPVPVGTPPVAVITVPGTVWAGVPVTLSGAKSTSTGAGVTEWEWSLDGRPGFEHDSLSSAWVSKSFTTGKHTVTLRVRNGAGLVDTASKTFTVRKAPASAVEPLALTAVQATADGTAVDVSWEPLLSGDVLAYRVSIDDDSGSDPIYVPADATPQARFDDLVPGEYRIRVAAINAAGVGPATDAAAKVLAKGDPTSSASATATSTATSTPDATTTSSTTDDSTAPTTSSSSNGDSRDTIGLVLIGAGGVVLLGAATTAAVAGWRRRHPA